MGHDFQELLMTPDIIFMRGDVKVTHEDLLVIAFGKTLRKIETHIFKKI